MYSNLGYVLYKNDMSLVYAWVMWVRGDTNALWCISGGVVPVMVVSTDTIESFLKYPILSIFLLGRLIFGFKRVI